jgi:hydrogenase nickel incorporation protein HypB
MTRTIHRRDALDRLLDRLAAPVDDLLGPLRAHRTGLDDHDHVDGGDEDDVLAAYREQAEALHERVVHDHGVFVAEFLGATGSGKTRLLERLVERAPDEERIAVVVGDVAGDDDARRYRELGLEVANVNTGKECHLDPALLEDAIAGFDLEALDRLYVENVGNMVCPADFPLGAQARVLVVSTTEGDDVVRKHPLLFQACDATVVNKVDIAGAVDADVGAMRRDVAAVAPGMPVFETSAKHDDGVDDLAAFLAERREGSHEHGEGHEQGHDHAMDHEQGHDPGEGHDHAMDHEQGHDPGEGHAHDHGEEHGHGA